MIERSPRAPVLRSMALRAMALKAVFSPPQDRGLRLLVTGNGIKLSMLFFLRVDVALSSCRNPRKELETRMHQVPTDTKRRMPSSRVPEEVIH